MSSGFISESQIEERNRKRQEEWEKVRQPDQPLVAPEEEYDHRTLFERLEEQKKRKEFEYEETHRLKNMIKGLDDDEVDFLEMVDRSKMEEEKRLLSEEAKELQQFRSKVASLEEKCLDQRIAEDVTPVISSIKKTVTTSSRSPMNKLLAGAVITKCQNIKSVASVSKNVANIQSPSIQSSAKESLEVTTSEFNKETGDSSETCNRSSVKRSHDDDDDDDNGDGEKSSKYTKNRHNNSSSDNDNDKPDLTAEPFIQEFRCPTAFINVGYMPSFYGEENSSNDSSSSEEDYLSTICYPPVINFQNEPSVEEGTED